MSKIVKASELVVPTIVVGGIYGQAGVGKSTIALSAPQPLLIDTDGGVHRINAEHRCDTVQVKSYQDILDVLNEDLSAYESIVIDTLGEMVNFISNYFIAKDPSLVTRGGTLNIKIWGLIKAEFAMLKLKMKQLNKNLIFVAHEKEEKDGETRVCRLDVAGSTGKDVVKILDFLGYCEMIGKRRTISFSPCQRYYAKNSINLDDMIQIPTLDEGDENNFISEMMIKPSIQRRNEAHAELVERNKLMEQGRKIISGNEPNEAIKLMKDLGLPKYESQKLFQELKASTEMIYNIDTKVFG